MRVGFEFQTSFTSSVIPIIAWLQSLFRILLGYRIYKTVEYFKGLYLRNLKELAVFIEFTEVLEILVYRVSRVF